jgi:hypothetical protein
MLMTHLRILHPGGRSITTPEQEDTEQEQKQTNQTLTTLTEKEKKFRAALQELDVSYDYTRKAFYHGEEPIPHDELLRRLAHRAELGIQVATMADYLAMWVAEVQRQEVLRVRESITPCTEEGRQELKKLVKLICSEGHEYSELMLRQWIWQVKRKFYGLPLMEHVMPVLRGRQGCGKTTVIRALMSPLEPLVGTWDFCQIADDRHWLGMETCFVGYVEELAGADRKTMDALKSVITTPSKTVRIMNTQIRREVQVNTSFIGDTNHRVADVIKDTTGGRRFWEVRCRDRFAWSEIEKIDWLLVWHCVGHEEDAPKKVSSLRGDISALQERKIRSTISVDHWLDEVGYEPGNRAIALSVLYGEYGAYCNMAREASLGLTDFRKYMEARGFVYKTAKLPDPEKGNKNVKSSKALFVK